MDITLDVVAFIKTIFANKIVKKYTEEFSNRALVWLRNTFSKKDPQLVQELEQDPNEINTHTRLAIEVNELLKDPDFLEKIRSYMEQAKQNVVNESSISNNKVDSGGHVIAEIENDKNNGSKSAIENNTIKSAGNTELRIKNGKSN